MDRTGRSAVRRPGIPLSVSREVRVRLPGLSAVRSHDKRLNAPVTSMVAWIGPGEAAPLRLCGAPGERIVNGFVNALRKTS